MRSSACRWPPTGSRLPPRSPREERSDGSRRRHPAEGAADQPRPAVVRDDRRDRRRPGGGPLVLPGRRRGRDGGQVDVGLRHGRQRRGLRQGRPLRLDGPAAGDAGPRVPAEPRPARRRARRRHGVLRVRRHRGGPQLSRRQRVPRLDGREVPVAPARRGQPDHPARADARRRGVAAAGGARRRRRQPAARRVLPAPRAGAAGREPAGPADHRPDRDRHDPAQGHRVPRRSTTG